jgi:hypothetical protein
VQVVITSTLEGKGLAQPYFEGDLSLRDAIDNVKYLALHISAHAVLLMASAGRRRCRCTGCG